MHKHDYAADVTDLVRENIRKGVRAQVGHRVAFEFEKLNFLYLIKTVYAFFQVAEGQVDDLIKEDEVVA